jgi:hypothetical protein
MSRDFSPEAKEVVRLLRNAANGLIQDTGCRTWSDSKHLTSVTANFSGGRPTHHLGTIPFEEFLDRYDEAIAKLESLLSANAPATGESN